MAVMPVAVLLISKLPVRQITINFFLTDTFNISKLPVRQITRFEDGVHLFFFSKLPVRQITLSISREISLYAF